MAWHLHRAGIPLIWYYFDDFIIVAPPGSSQCQELLSILDHECQALGVPIADHKRNGPTTCLTYLGIEVDTGMGQLRLPNDKLRRVKSLLCEWGAWHACTRKELESLIGLLSHACKVVRYGRSFLRRMIDLHSIQSIVPPTLLSRSGLIRGSSRPGMVAPIPRKMEWSLFPAPASLPTRG